MSRPTSITSQRFPSYAALTAHAGVAHFLSSHEAECHFLWDKPPQYDAALAALFVAALTPSDEVLAVLCYCPSQMLLLSHCSSDSETCRQAAASELAQATAAFAEEQSCTVTHVAGEKTFCDAFVRALAKREPAELPRMDQTAYHCGKVVPDPRGVPPGSCRAATAEDLDVVAGFLQGFMNDVALPGLTRMSVEAARAFSLARIEAKRCFLWCDENGVVVAMAQQSGASPHLARVGQVYTPEEHRKHGYGRAVTSHLVEHLLSQGETTHAFLFADQAYAASNSLYRAMGFVPLFESTMVLVGS